MREAICVYGTIGKDEGEFYFDGMTPQTVKTLVKRTKWLKWEKRPSDKAAGRDKWFLVADFSDKDDKDEWERTRKQRLSGVFLEEGMILFYRASREEEFTDDYEKYVWK